MPNSFLEFFYLVSFERSRKGVLDDEEMRIVEIELMENPEAGAVVAGTGGVRKIRVSQTGRGKRGSARVLYYYMGQRQRVYFMLAYAKSDQPDLTSQQKALLRWIVSSLK